MPSHQTLRRLTYFAAIAEAGSIRRAAARLGLSVPVVSEALSQLEAELDLTLAHRTTRSFALTDAGRTVHAAAADMLRLVERIQRLGDPDAPLTGRLAVTLPVELAADWLAERLRPFQSRHPRLDIVIAATDTVIDLGAGLVDIAVRTTYLAPGRTDPRRQTLPLICVARSRPSMTPGRDDQLMLDTALLNWRPDSWFEGRDHSTGRTMRLRSRRTIVIDNRAAAIAMAREGLGAALVLERSVRADLDNGRLVAAAPGLDFGAIAIDFVFRDSLPSPPARAFVAFLRDFAGAGGSRCET